MNTKRQNRLNSLLKEILSEIISREIHDPSISPLITVTKVSITKDLKHAKVYISVIGDKKNDMLEKINSYKRQITNIAFKKVSMRYFPELTFILDTSLDNFFKVDKILKDIQDERNSSSK